MKDYRPENISKLEQKGIYRDWVIFWEHDLHPELSEMDSGNQREWHNSVSSFLKGYETAIAETLTNSSMRNEK